MITLRPAAERGHSAIGWLESWHTFSFADYYDERHMGFRALRVINDDVIQGGQGFDTHGHRDMEIITWILDGALAHRDSLGNGDVLRPGDVQRMSAGTGIRHSEFNYSATAPVHLLQIWIEPDRTGLPPGYEQQNVPLAERRDRWCRIADSTGSAGALRMGADAVVSTTVLGAGSALRYGLDPRRHAWLHCARGEIRLGDRRLTAGDAAAFSAESEVAVTAVQDSELLLFDLA